MAMTSKRKKADTELGTKILRNMARVIEREREKRGLNKKEMAELIDLGVDGLESDRIDVLKNVLVQRGLWHGKPGATA